MRVEKREVQAGEGAGHAAREAAVLTKATTRTAEFLGLSSAELARTIGLSEASVSRLRSGRYELSPGTKPFELAVLLVRLYRALDSLMGDDQASRGWLRARNVALEGRPLDMIQTVAGLVNVIQYLDSRRARV
jgi:uncharacterized protein (DUF2384 family)